MDLVSMVQQELNETGTGVFWPIQTVYDKINEAQVETFPLQYLPLTTALMTFTVGADLVTWPNTTLMWPHWFEQGGRQYWVIKHADLERYDRNWRNETQSQPKFFVLWDESRIRPYPSPDQTYVYTVWGPGWQPEIGTSVSGTTTTTTSDVPSTTPPLLKAALAFRAAARLFQNNRPDMAEAHNKEADYYEALYRVQWRRQQSDNIKRLLPLSQVGYTHAQGGNIRIAKRIDGNPSNPYR